MKGESGCSFTTLSFYFSFFTSPKISFKLKKQKNLCAAAARLASWSVEPSTGKKLQKQGSSRRNSFHHFRQQTFLSWIPGILAALTILLCEFTRRNVKRVDRKSAQDRYQLIEVIAQKEKKPLIF